MTELQNDLQLNGGAQQINIYDVVVGLQEGAFLVEVQDGEVKIAVSDQVLDVIPNADDQLLEHLRAVIIVARHLGMEFTPEILAMAAVKQQEADSQ